MTQVPGPSQRPVDAPVVPGDASTPERPAAERTAPAIDRASALYDRLWNLIDDRLPERDIVRSDAAATIADAIFADTNLLDALVAYQQHRVIETRAQLAESPTGTVIRTSQGDTWLIDHGPQGEWVGGRTRIYCQEPNTELVYYPANFDLSLPVTVLWSPPDTTERPNE